MIISIILLALAAAIFFMSFYYFFGSTFPSGDVAVVGFLLGFFLTMMGLFRDIREMENPIYERPTHIIVDTNQVSAIVIYRGFKDAQLDKDGNLFGPRINESITISGANAKTTIMEPDNAFVKITASEALVGTFHPASVVNLRNHEIKELGLDKTIEKE